MWKSEEDKLNKSGRKWKPSLDGGWHNDTIDVW